ncbi:hypothetical protein ABPG75_011391 [Micractinium tetrahymenae]
MFQCRALAYTNAPWYARSPGKHSDECPPPRSPPPWPPPANAAIVGDPHYRGFDYTGGPYDLFVGQPGQTYTLYSDGRGATLAALFGAGGPTGKATFIRAITLSRGPNRTSATLARLGASWVLQVTANGRPVGAMQTVKIGDDIVVQATPVKAGRPSGIIVSLPYLRIRAAQREAYKQGQAQPDWGSWLDVYLTVLAPLPTPVGGILGRTYSPARAQAAASAGSGVSAAAAIPALTAAFEAPLMP